MAKTPFKGYGSSPSTPADLTSSPLTIEHINEAVARVRDQGGSMARQTISYATFTRYRKLKKMIADGNVLTQDQSVEFLFLKAQVEG